MPSLIRELHVMVPSLRAMFFFADRSGGLDHIFTESVENAATTELYVKEFHGRPDREPPGLSFADAMRDQVGVHDLEAMRIDQDAFARTDFYNALFRPVGRGADYIRLVMRDRGKGLGMVTVFREPGDKHFAPEEKRRLAMLEPFFVHALKGRRGGEAELVTSSERGLIVADCDGRTKHISPRGLELLFRAIHPRVSRDARPFQWATLPQSLQYLCRCALRAGGDGDVAAPPSVYIRNIWGGFEFRAEPLADARGQSGLVGIVVSHEEPFDVRLVRRIGDLPLSPQQARVCLELARGATNAEIAERMGVSVNTVIAHRRWAYDKLGVSTRPELLDRIL